MSRDLEPQLLPTDATSKANEEQAESLGELCVHTPARTRNKCQEP